MVVSGCLSGAHAQVHLLLEPAMDCGSSSKEPAKLKLLLLEKPKSAVWEHFSFVASLLRRTRKERKKFTVCCSASYCCTGSLLVHLKYMHKAA